MDISQVVSALQGEKMLRGGVTNLRRCFEVVFEPEKMPGGVGPVKIVQCVLLFEEDQKGYPQKGYP